jgi:hypothetical protein
MTRRNSSKEPKDVRTCQYISLSKMVHKMSETKPN